MSLSAVTEILWRNGKLLSVLRILKYLYVIDCCFKIYYICQCCNKRNRQPLTIVANEKNLFSVDDAPSACRCSGLRGKEPVDTAASLSVQPTLLEFAATGNGSQSVAVTARCV